MLSQRESPSDGPLLGDVEGLPLRVDFVVALRPMMNVVGPAPCRPHLAAVQTLFVGDIRRLASSVVTELLEIAADGFAADDVEPGFSRGQLTASNRTTSARHGSCDGALARYKTNLPNSAKKSDFDEKIGVKNGKGRRDRPFVRRGERLTQRLASRGWRVWSHGDLVRSKYASAVISDSELYAVFAQTKYGRFLPKR